MSPMKWFYGYLKKYRLLMFLGFIMITALSVLAIVNPYISGMIVDDVIDGGNHDLLPKLIILILAVTVARGLIRFFAQMVFETCSQGMLYTLRDTVYKKLLKEDFNFYNKNRTGDLMSRQTGDMDAIRHFIAYVVSTVYENFLMLIFALIMMFTVNIKLALGMLIVLPLTAFTTYRQSKDVKPAFWKIRQQFSSLNAFVQENISGNRVVKAFAKEDFEKEKFQKENEAYKNSELDAAKIWRRYVPVFEFLSNVLIIVLMLYGGYMVITGEITLGNLVTINGYLWMLTNPLRMVGWWINDFQRFSTSIEKIYVTYSTEPDVKAPESSFRKEHFNGDIEFKNVSYHAEDVDIIQNINFSVKAGQTVGVIGSTGSGKSTIMNLLCRFYDVTEGSITVDGTDVRELDLYDLRANIGMAMQDVFLFSDTIEGNIAYGKPDCPFDSVKVAAIMADANHFIKEMPDGYDTIVGERGVGLSGGQKQRISLARALLKDPSILILDDTTSAVDMETESYIQDQLAKIDNKCTTFIIAYRISSIKDSDLILVMDKGKIVESGTHTQLIANNGYYRTVFEHQYGSLDEINLEEVM